MLACSCRREHFLCNPKLGHEHALEHVKRLLANKVAHLARSWEHEGWKLSFQLIPANLLIPGNERGDALDAAAHVGEPCIAVQQLCDARHFIHAGIQRRHPRLYVDRALPPNPMTLHRLCCTATSLLHQLRWDCVFRLEKEFLLGRTEGQTTLFVLRWRTFNVPLGSALYTMMPVGRYSVLSAPLGAMCVCGRHTVSLWNLGLGSCCVLGSLDVRIVWRLVYAGAGSAGLS